MAAFTVNGASVTVEKNQRLIRYLRDTMHLTSVKDGCSEGACGACTVLVDGEPCQILRSHDRQARRTAPC
jgi:aerobic-type carbon monoxide dehydrogenase small subunit (CoxS/CutS family)